MKKLLHFFAICLIAFAVILPGVVLSQRVNADGDSNSMQLETNQREWFRNLTNPGSCVQCSIGMCGVHCNDPSATLLLWQSEYGKPELHGSGPDRVARYMKSRNIKGYNVTGWPATKVWMKWACKTGRFAAIGAGGNHFQTLYGWDEKTNTWYVCNNNSPQRIDQYTDKQFDNLHLASGPWIVILANSSSEHPEMVKYWQEG